MAMIGTNRSGFINTAFVKWIKNRKRPGAAKDASWQEKYSTFVVDNEGEEYEVHPNDHALTRLKDEFDEVIIPATQPMTVIGVWGLDDPNPDELPIIEHHPIIAWRIGNMGWPTPIAPGCPSLVEDDASEHYFILLPSGKYQQCGFERDMYNTLEEGIESLRTTQRTRHGKIPAAET